MQLFVTGLSHKTAPIAVRERLAFSDEGLELALSKLKRLPAVSEVVVLSTCNRTEIYGISGEAERGAAEVAGWLGDRSASDLSPHLYTHLREEALRHLFRVASSLDSMVVGEPQILGQVKDAFSFAQRQRSAGPHIERLFTRAFRVAKQVRNETRIAENAVSMSFVAVELGKKIFGSIEGKAVLLIGAGKMSELAATHLRNAGCTLVVANRSPERARRLAELYGGYARSLGEVPALLREVDIVLSSTAAPGYVVTKEMLAGVLRKRRYRPLFLIDLALPRDVDPAVNDLEQVYAYDIDDLQQVVDENLQQRLAEAERGEQIVRRELGRFLQEQSARSVQPVVASLRWTAERIALREVEKTLGRLGHLADGDRARIEAMARAIVKKLLHLPTMSLKAGAGTPEGERLAAAITE
ncbi:MAG: glutamyl-tRNA reductase, partial [Deltaproteobacteria bacterium]